MRKPALALLAGLLLVAGQAAASSSAAVRVGDRVGAKSDTANQFADVPVAVMVMTGLVVTGAVVIASQDDGPTSP